VTELSPALQQFVGGLPLERGPILEFVAQAAEAIPAGARVLDVGAGDSPYRELFEHVKYETSDWEHSVHPGARKVDHIGPADDLPVGDAEFDAVILTQVLEHVPEPVAVLKELGRVVKPGGRLYVTVPLAWELHELPFDFWRYTSPGLHALLTAADLRPISIAPRNDCFSTLAQLVANVGHTLGAYPDGRDGERAQAAAELGAMAQRMLAFTDLDVRKILPLGYGVIAERPDGITTQTGSGDLAAAGLDGARAFRTLTFAADILADPAVLRAYAEQFSGADDATLVIYAPGVDVDEAGQRLMQLVSAVGLDGADAPDMLALPTPGRGPEDAIAAACHAVLSRQPPWSLFGALPWVHVGSAAKLKELASQT
jgi:SAM-dependent methyltransferase